jgi:hypothetical protein
MKRTWLGFFVLVFPLLAVGQNNVTTGSLALGQRVSANGHTTLASSGPIFDTTQFAGGGIAADIADCLTALATGPGTCDASSEPAQTTAATINISVSGVVVLMPPVTITLGSGFFLWVTAANSGFICGGAARSCILNSAPAGVTTAIILAGASGDFVVGMQIPGGRCGIAGCSSSTGSSPNTENAITMTGTDHQVLNNLITDSGHIGVSLSLCNSCIVRDNEIDRAGWAGIVVNTATSGTSLNNRIITNLLEDDNVLANPGGSIEISCSMGTSCGYSTDGTLVEGNTVRFLVLSPTISACTGSGTLLTTLDTGCNEGIQSTDRAYHTTFLGNHVYNSILEGLVCGAIGCVVVGNTCDACGLSGGGALMWSYGVASTIPVGDAVYANNVITDSNTTLTLLYCASLQSTNSSSVTYENIKFVNNTCSGGLSGATAGFTNGFRYVNTGGGTVTLSDVDFSGNTASDKITTPFKLTYTNTTGVVLLNNNIPMPAPTISSGFGTSPSIVNNNGPYSFTINVGTGGTANSGIIGFYAAPDGWSVSCTDVTNPTTGGGFLTKQTASTTTTATVKGYSSAGAPAVWTASDILNCQASPY